MTIFSQPKNHGTSRSERFHNLKINNFGMKFGLIDGEIQENFYKNIPGYKLI